eukprot:1833464-Alexandrium_andersonii.AAC.1
MCVPRPEEHQLTTSHQLLGNQEGNKAVDFVVFVVFACVVHADDKLILVNGDASLAESGECEGQLLACHVGIALDICVAHEYQPKVPMADQPCDMQARTGNPIEHFALHDRIPRPSEFRLIDCIDRDDDDATVGLTGRLQIPAHNTIR